MRGSEDSRKLEKPAAEANPYRPLQTDADPLSCDGFIV
jgi:hypothetical protein